MIGANSRTLIMREDFGFSKPSWEEGARFIFEIDSRWAKLQELAKVRNDKEK